MSLPEQIPGTEPLTDQAESARLAADSEPEIIEEDASFAIVHKPAGWLTVPGTPGTLSSRDPSVQAWLAERWKQPSGEPGFVGTVHRLDRPVSGVMVWAKSSRSARRLAEQFSGGKVIKQYWAVVAGQPAQSSGTWEDWLILQKHDGRHVVRRCAPGTPQGQPAHTDWQKVAASGLKPDLTWLSLWPRTGRMHQLRVQTAERGWPILGDSAYGSVAEWPHPWKIALHARSLTFRHPETQQLILVEAAVGPHWSCLGDVQEWFEPTEKYRVKRS